jgi:hypothetical protein
VRPLAERLSYRSLQRLFVLVVALHNLEEGVAVPAFLPRLRAHLQQIAALRDVAPPTAERMYVALAVVTLVPALLVGWATTGRDSVLKREIVAVLVAALLWNVVLPHVPAAIIFGGYAPGVLTAVAINLPFAVYFFRRSARERMLTRRQIGMALLIGLLLLMVAPPLLLLAG